MKKICIDHIPNDMNGSDAINYNDFVLKDVVKKAVFQAVNALIDENNNDANKKRAGFNNERGMEPFGCEIFLHQNYAEVAFFCWAHPARENSTVRVDRIFSGKVRIFDAFDIKYEPEFSYNEIKRD